MTEGPYEPTWESLKAYTIPEWYIDAKFGIFIHWGVYAVPAFGNEWYPRQMYMEGTAEFAHHVETYGPQSKFGYKDFIPMFKAEKYDPAHWDDLFAKAGARFVVPVAEHHDGFAMYNSQLSEWTAMKMGPKRDLIGELAAAVRERGMVFGASTHREEHWWFLNGGMKFESDVQDPEYADFYGPAAPDGTEPDAVYLEDWLKRTCELVDLYRPQIVWFDWWINTPAFAPYLARFAAYYYNRGVQWGLGVAINYKEKAYPDGTAVLDLERGQLADIRPLLWQNDTSVIKNSWGYVEDRDYKTAEAILGDLIDVVSKNGALLLNIGPRADGTIPEEEEAILLEIGRWLALNGEAIYETRPWKVFGEGPTVVEEGGFTDTKRAAFVTGDVRFTTRGDFLYALLLAWPENGEAVIESLGTNLRLYTAEVGTVEMLGAAGPLEFSRDEKALRVKLPAARPCDHAFVLKISKRGKDEA